MTQIISIHSFRGGTGKSNVTANLAAQAAMAGKRVAVVDTDIQSPGIHVLFGLDEANMKYTLNDYLHGKCAVTEAATLVGRGENPQPGAAQLADKLLWLVPSSIKTDEVARVVREGYEFNVLNKGFKTLRAELQLDYLLIDTHPGVNEETLLSIGISDKTVIILRPDQQDFQGTAVTLDVARGLDAANIYLLVNKIPEKINRSGVSEEVEAKFNAAVAGVLPLSEDMAELASADIFSLRNPNHVWSRELRRAAETILGLGGLS